MKIRDYSAIQTNFENVVKNVASSRTQAIIVAHGGLPRFYVKLLVELDDYLDERKKDKEAFKKLSATQGRALNRLCLTVKKHNKQYEKIITEYRQNPGLPDDKEDEDESKDSDDDDVSDSSSSSPVVRKKKPAKVSDSSDSDDMVRDKNSVFLGLSLVSVLLSKIFGGGRNVVSRENESVLYVTVIYIGFRRCPLFGSYVREKKIPRF